LLLAQPAMKAERDALAVEVAGVVEQVRFDCALTPCKCWLDADADCREMRGGISKLHGRYIYTISRQRSAKHISAIEIRRGNPKRPATLIALHHTARDFILIAQCKCSIYNSAMRKQPANERTAHRRKQMIRKRDLHIGHNRRGKSKCFAKLSQCIHIGGSTATKTKINTFHQCDRLMLSHEICNKLARFQRKHFSGRHEDNDFISTGIEQQLTFAIRRGEAKRLALWPKNGSGMRIKGEHLHTAARLFRQVCCLRNDRLVSKVNSIEVANRHDTVLRHRVQRIVLIAFKDERSNGMALFEDRAVLPMACAYNRSNTWSNNMAKSKESKSSTGSLIEIGSAAPAIKLQNQSDELIELKQLKGSWIVLYFYPKDDTPGCTTEACSFRDAMKEFTDRGVIVLGVSPDDEKSHAKFAKKHKLPFDLLADSEQRVCEAYGVWQEKSMYGQTYMGVVRTTYVIDPKGTVAQRWDKVKVKGHEAAVLAAIDELMQDAKS